MNKAQLDSFRQHLLILRKRLTGDVSHLTDEALRRNEANDGRQSGMPIHMADLGTDNFEQEFSLSLLANEEQVLSEIAAAIDRMDQGTFGRCEECQVAIARPRLEALPYTRHCVACARRLEQSK